MCNEAKKLRVMYKFNCLENFYSNVRSVEVEDKVIVCQRKLIFYVKNLNYQQQKMKRKPIELKDPKMNND